MTLFHRFRANGLARDASAAEHSLASCRCQWPPSACLRAWWKSCVLAPPTGRWGWINALQRNNNAKNAPHHYHLRPHVSPLKSSENFSIRTAWAAS